MSSKILSKSSYLTGLQCPKLLWVKIHEKERLPEIDSAKKAIFNSGNIIGELAKKLFINGIDIPTDNFTENLNLTIESITKRVPLFEPAFLIDRLYSRADILVPTENNEWDIYEVKSSTKVKDINLHDLSFQKYTYEKAGLKIRNSHLIHINNQFVLDKEILPEEFFHITNVTEKVNDFSIGIKRRINEFLQIIDSPEPTFEIGTHCTSPYECDIKPECWKHPEGNVFELYLDTEKGFNLFQKGIIHLKDIPEDYELTTKQFIQKSCATEQKNHLNKEKINEFLNKLKYPIYYLDFETINPAIPKFINMRPYQRIPFQYSLHIQNSPEEKPKHISYLHKTSSDPRPTFLQSLKDNLGEKGTILVYNQGFEKSVLKECTTEFPNFSKWFEQIEKRILDLLIPFKNFDYYSPKQKGSASIKKVLPIFSDLNYNDLEINRGDIANTQYEKAVFGDISSTEQERIFNNLEEYCAQDTFAEIEIVKGLQNEIKE